MNVVGLAIAVPVTVAVGPGFPLTVEERVKEEISLGSVTPTVTELKVAVPPPLLVIAKLPPATV